MLFRSKLLALSTFVATAISAPLAVESNNDLTNQEHAVAVEASVLPSSHSTLSPFGWSPESSSPTQAQTAPGVDFNFTDTKLMKRSAWPKKIGQCVKFDNTLRQGHRDVTWDLWYIFDIRNWAFTDTTHTEWFTRQIYQCFGAEPRGFRKGQDENGNPFFFFQGYGERSGCIERAIVTAGGPVLKRCAYGGAFDLEREFLSEYIPFNHTTHMIGKKWKPYDIGVVPIGPNGFGGDVPGQGYLIQNDGTTIKVPPPYKVDHSGKSWIEKVLFPDEDLHHEVSEEWQCKTSLRPWLDECHPDRVNNY